MKTIRKLLTTLVLLSTSALATAGVTSFGDYDCGEWFKRPPAKSWLLGFLSGLNAVIAEEKKDMPKYDPLNTLNSAEQANLWMDNYCRANPLKRVSGGALDLYLKLQEQMK